MFLVLVINCLRLRFILVSITILTLSVLFIEMSCSSSTGWNTPSVLPLGMKFTDLKTRDARNISDSFVDFRNETVSEVDYLDLSDSLLRFSSK